MTWLERTRQPRAVLLALVLLVVLWPDRALAQAIQYERPVDVAPQEKTIGGGYKTPAVQKPLPARVLAAGARRRAAGRRDGRSRCGWWFERRSRPLALGADDRVPGLLRLLSRGLHLPHRLHSERRGGADRSRLFHPDGRHRDLLPAAGRGAVLRPGVLRRRLPARARSRNWWC